MQTYLFEQGEIKDGQFVTMAWAMSGELSAKNQEHAIAKVRRYYPWNVWTVATEDQSIVFTTPGQALRLTIKAN
jgi:hypothetical protein